MYCMFPHLVAARLKNGSPELSLDPTINLPPDLIRCKQLWDRRGKRGSWPRDQWAFVRATVEPLLYATLDPDPVHYDNGLMAPRGTIRSSAVGLSSVSFEHGPVPVISACARFELTFDRVFTSTAALYDWMEGTDWLDWGTNFGWRLPDGSEYDAAQHNDGLEFEAAYY